MSNVAVKHGMSYVIKQKTFVDIVLRNASNNLRSY